MEKTEKKKKKNPIIKKTLNTVLVLGLMWGSFNYSPDIKNMYHKIVGYKVSSYGIQHPYDIELQREITNNKTILYLHDSVTNKKIQIYKGLRLGDLNYRIESIIGDNEDRESLSGKYNKIKVDFSEKITNFYNNITNKLYKNNKNNKNK